MYKVPFSPWGEFFKFLGKMRRGRKEERGEGEKREIGRGGEEAYKPQAGQLPPGQLF